MPEFARKHIRFPIYATAAIKIKNRKKEALIFTLVNNISQSGVGIYAYTPIPEGTAVSVELSFFVNNKTENKDSIEGTVAWMSKEGDLYFVGIYFAEELNPYKHPNLYNHFFKKIHRD